MTNTYMQHDILFPYRHTLFAISCAASMYYNAGEAWRLMITYMSEHQVEL